MAKYGRIFRPVPPGITPSHFINQMINYGQQIRERMLWELPLIGGAAFTYQQMASRREWRVFASKATSASRAVEYLNNAAVINKEGFIEYGLEIFTARQVMDYLCVGRTLFCWDEGKPLTYLDPCDTHFDISSRQWIDDDIDAKYPFDRVSVYHPIPVGSQGMFVSPLSFIMPTAILAWLIREHDRAAADGRKIRDITVVLGEQLGDEIKVAIEDTVNLWSGADPTKSGVPVVVAELAEGRMKASDYVAQIGLANIPANFDREGFQFQFVNEVANATGLALRYIWNSEKATNRALEQVQEARQQFRGPSSFVRTQDRQFNHCGMLKQFGARTRFAYVEEVDTQSREVNARVIKEYAQAFKIFAETFPQEIVDFRAFLSWLKTEQMLPADLELLKDETIEESDKLPTPHGNETIQESDKSFGEKRKNNEPDYGEFVVNQDGELVERREKVFSIEKAIRDEIDIEEIIKSQEVEIPTFRDAIMEVRAKDLVKFKSTPYKAWTSRDDLEKARSLRKKSRKPGSLTQSDYLQIKRLLQRIS